MCNKCNVYINYLTGDISSDIINEFNHRTKGSFINDNNIDSFRTHPLLLKLAKKYDSNIKFEKVLNNKLIPISNNLSIQNYICLLIYLLDKWSDCDCIKINNNPIHIIMNFKIVLKLMEELNLIPSDLCCALKKILRYKVHIKDQLTFAREKICSFI